MKNIGFKTVTLMLLLVICSANLQGLEPKSTRGIMNWGNGYPEFYLINPNREAPLRVKVENDSVMRLWVEDTTQGNSSNDESQEWLLFCHEPLQCRYLLLENITDRYNPQYNGKKGKSSLLKKFADVDKIASYPIDFNNEFHGEITTLNGYPMFLTDKGNPFILEMDSIKPTEMPAYVRVYDKIAENAILACTFPREILRYQSKTDFLHTIRLDMDRDILRIEYTIPYNYDFVYLTEKYVIDLLSDMSCKNPIIHIGQMVYSNRDDVKNTLGKKEFAKIEKQYPVLTGEEILLLSLENRAYSYAVLNGNVFAKMFSPKDEKGKLVYENDDWRNKPFWFELDGQRIFVGSTPLVEPLAFSKKGVTHRYNTLEHNLHSISERVFYDEEFRIERKKLEQKWSKQLNEQLNKGSNGNDNGNLPLGVKWDVEINRR